MINIIMAIAALCSVHSSSNAINVDSVQRDCHQYYMKCIDDSKYNEFKALPICIRERKN